MLLYVGTHNSKIVSTNYKNILVNKVNNIHKYRMTLNKVLLNHYSYQD
jgi:hypothetical protein